MVEKKGPLQTQIEKKLREQFQPTHIDLMNESHKHHRPIGAETHFKLQMVSNRFQRLKAIDRQRLVHEQLKEELLDSVHAFTQKLYTPEEWDALPADKKVFRAIGHNRTGALD